MLGGQDHHLHAGVFAGLHPLADVELGRIEDRRVFRALAPLLVREGVDRVMDECDELQVLPGELLRRRADIRGTLDQCLRRIACGGRGRSHRVVHADVVHDELVGQLGLLDVAAPLADLLGELGEFRDLGHPASASPPGLLAVDVEHIFLGRPVQAEGVIAFAQAGKIELRADGLVLLAIAVPVQVLRGAVLAPGLLHDVDLGAVASVVADLAHAVGHEPEGRPVPLLLGEFAPADPVPVAMLELAFGADGPAGVAVAVFLRAQDQIALAVEIGILFDPESVPPLPVAKQLPLGLIHGGAVEFVAPGELPALSLAKGREEFPVGGSPRHPGNSGKQRQAQNEAKRRRVNPAG